MGLGVPGFETMNTTASGKDADIVVGGTELADNHVGKKNRADQFVGEQHDADINVGMVT